MHDSIRALHAQFELNTRLFLNCLHGVDDDAALNRPGPGSNHMAFVACHLLDARCFLARLVGAVYANPYQERFDAAQGIEEMRDFPPIDGLCAAWREASTALSGCLPGLTADDLERESPQKFPVNDPSLRGGIAFLLAHEAFHIGQLAYLRKFNGLGPMGY